MDSETPERLAVIDGDAEDNDDDNDDDKGTLTERGGGCLLVLCVPGGGGCLLPPRVRGTPILSENSRPAKSSPT